MTATAAPPVEVTAPSGRRPRVTGRWLGPLAVTAPGVLRFNELGRLHAFVFDETYYAKDAPSLTFGYERGFVDKADKKISAPTG